jgi:CubicO group peptidase (beta-lactamase class C family)
MVPASMARLTTSTRTALTALERDLPAALEAWEAPGLAIAVVRDDEVVFARGYGVRELRRRGRRGAAPAAAPVDERTLFAAGSTTKAFTAAAVGVLVDEGRLGWDDRVAERLPGFALFDPYATREVTLRDLLCHRTGLPRGDHLWYGSGLDRDAILRRVRHLAPAWSFRSRYGYQNIMYLAAGQVVAAVAGESWDDFVRRRFLDPLGMTATTTSTDALPRGGNVAAPHGRLDGALTPIPYRNLDNIAPAGAVNSNAVELAQWVRLQLAGGEYAGRRLIGEAALRETHTPHVVVVPEQPEQEVPVPETHFRLYGLGWGLSDYRGHAVVEHAGGIDGMRALVTLVPEARLGLVVLVNRGDTSLPEAVRYHALDLLLGVPARARRPWLTELRDRERATRAKIDAARERRDAERVPGTAPSLPLERYAGTYRHDCYGEVGVAREDGKQDGKDGKLVLRYGQGFLGDLEHWHFDTFRVVWRDRLLGDALVTFALDARGRVARLTVPIMGEFWRPPEPDPDGAAEPPGPATEPPARAPAPAPRARAAARPRPAGRRATRT